MKWIISEDPADEKTFDGGFDALARWHREQTSTAWPFAALLLVFGFGFRRRLDWIDMTTTNQTVKRCGPKTNDIVRLCLPEAPRHFSKKPTYLHRDRTLLGFACWRRRATFRRNPLIFKPFHEAAALHRR
jgi:hypothetical protein